MKRNIMQYISAIALCFSFLVVGCSSDVEVGTGSNSNTDSDSGSTGGSLGFSDEEGATDSDITVSPNWFSNIGVEWGTLDSDLRDLMSISEKGDTLFLPFVECTVEFRLSINNDVTVEFREEWAQQNISITALTDSEGYYNTFKIDTAQESVNEQGWMAHLDITRKGFTEYYESIVIVKEANPLQLSDDDLL